jgi:hypothetical protein
MLPPVALYTTSTRTLSPALVRPNAANWWVALVARSMVEGRSTTLTTGCAGSGSGSGSGLGSGSGVGSGWSMVVSGTVGAVTWTGTVSARVPATFAAITS